MRTVLRQIGKLPFAGRSNVLRWLRYLYEETSGDQRDRRYHHVYRKLRNFALGHLGQCALATWGLFYLATSTLEYVVFGIYAMANALAFMAQISLLNTIFKDYHSGWKRTPRFHFKKLTPSEIIWSFILTLGTQIGFIYLLYRAW